MPLDSFAVRGLCAASSPRLGDHFALRALMRAHHLLSIALGLRLAELRYSEAPDARRFAQHEELSFQLPLALSAARILAERWKRLPERSRPHYLPEQRFEILRIKASLVLSAKEAARLFAISVGTVHRWEAELRLAQSADPRTSAIGQKFQPSPPVRRYADAVRSLVLTLSTNGFGGAERIAHTIARLGYAISARTVGRIRQEKILPVPSPPKAKGSARPAAPAAQADNLSTEKTSRRAVSARGPLDKLHIDITYVKSLFGLIQFRIAVVLDVFSRFPLAFSVYFKEPSAQDLLALFEKALAFGKPRILITDRGTIFRSELLAAALSALGVEHRFGALYRHGSIARLERLWRSLKDSLGVRAFCRRLLPEDFERDVRLALLHYAFYRPHAALKGATPAEVFLRLPPASAAAQPPPRGLAGQVVPFPDFVVEHLGPHLPIVHRKAA